MIGITAEMTKKDVGYLMAQDAEFAGRRQISMNNYSHFLGIWRSVEYSGNPER